MVTYKTRKKKESNLNTHVLLNINRIQIKVKDCQTRLKNKTLYYIQEIQRKRKNESKQMKKIHHANLRQEKNKADLCLDQTKWPWVKVSFEIERNTS